MNRKYVNRSGQQEGLGAGEWRPVSAFFQAGYIQSTIHSDSRERLIYDIGGHLASILGIKVVVGTYNIH